MFIIVKDNSGYICKNIIYTIFIHGAGLFLCPWKTSKDV